MQYLKVIFLFLNHLLAVRRPKWSMLHFRRRLCKPVEKHRPSACGHGSDVLCGDRPGFRVPSQLRHRAQGPQTWQVSSHLSIFLKNICAFRQHLWLLSFDLSIFFFFLIRYHLFKDRQSFWSLNQVFWSFSLWYFCQDLLCVWSHTQHPCVFLLLQFVNHLHGTH